MKTKVIELLYSWTLALPEESKIRDAYHMLKRQGVCPPRPHSAPEGGQGRNDGGCLLSPGCVSFSLPETVGRAWLGLRAEAWAPALSLQVPTAGRCALAA